MIYSFLVKLKISTPINYSAIDAMEILTPDEAEIIIREFRQAGLVDVDNLESLTTTFKRLGNYKILSPLYRDLNYDDLPDTSYTSEITKIYDMGIRYITNINTFMTHLYIMYDERLYCNTAFELKYMQSYNWPHVSKFRKFTPEELKQYSENIDEEQAWGNMYIPLAWLLNTYTWNAGLVATRLHAGMTWRPVRTRIEDMLYMYRKIGRVEYVVEYVTALLIFRRVLRHRAARRRYTDIIASDLMPREITKIVAQYAMISYHK